MFRVGVIGSIKIEDDRGISCGLAPPPDAFPKGNWRGKPREPLDAAMAAEWEWGNATARVFGGTIGLTMVLTGAFARWLLRGLPPIPGWIGAIAPSVLAAIIIQPANLPIARFLRKTRAEKLREGYIKSGRCASCGYSLSGLSAEEDGCRVCPECSRAWRSATR